MRENTPPHILRLAFDSVDFRDNILSYIKRFSVTLLGFCLVWRKIEQNNSISQIVCMVWCYNLESLSKKAAKFEKDEKSKSVY